MTHHPSRSRWRSPPPRKAGLAALAVLWLAGCAYHADQPCDPGQISADGGFCTCAAGSVPVAGSSNCVPCGENEVVQNNLCVCADGFVRPAEGGACMRGSLGAPCSMDKACAPVPYPTCHLGPSGGYCTTSGCASSAECEMGYACQGTGAAAYCRRPPVGQGKTCSGAADCAGTEATFCEAFSTHQCLVQGCNPSADDCFPGTKCCDLTARGLPVQLCLPLAAGMACP